MELDLIVVAGFRNHPGSQDRPTFGFFGETFDFVAGDGKFNRIPGQANAGAADLSLEVVGPRRRLAVPGYGASRQRRFAKVAASGPWRGCGKNRWCRPAVRYRSSGPARHQGRPVSE